MSKRSWISLHPSWYYAERRRLQKRYPELHVSEAELARGRLACAGSLSVRQRRERAAYPVLLLYPSGTPYQIPQLVLIREVPEGNDWTVEDVCTSTNLRRMPAGYRRHQMPGSALCLIEAEGHRQPECISGVEMLRRAEVVFRAIEADRPFPFSDTEEADLEAHLLPVGDILTGEAFQDSSLNGSGHFGAVLYPDRAEHSPLYVPQSQGNERILLIGAYASSTGSLAGTVETSWSNEASQALLRTFPWLAGSAFSFEAAALDSELRNYLQEGLWWDLPYEPEPPHVGHEVEELLREAGVDDPGLELQNLAEDLAPLILLAFRYPSRSGGREWLFLMLHPKEQPTQDDISREGEGIKREIMRAASVRAFRHHPVIRPQLELRNWGQVGETLREKTVLLIGAGALGGDVAADLGKAGIGRLIVADCDIMRSGNTIRHVAGLRSIGLSKTDAVRQVVHRHNPFVEVETIPGDVTADLGQLEDLLKRADLAVSTTADENVEMVINEAATRLGATVIYGRALRSGAAARVFRVRPRQDACKQCLALYHRDHKGHRQGKQIDPAVELVVRQWVDVPTMKDEIVGHECGHPILAGRAVDLRFAATFTARLALDELGEGTEGNVLTWSREPLPDVHEDLGTPFSTVLQNAAPHPHCPICRRPATHNIVLAASARDAIVQHTKAKPEVETGGVLIGFVDQGGSAVVLEATEAGPSATETNAQFERDAAYVQEQLKAAARRLGDQGQYLGEWHSHLEKNPSPSARDVESLTGISESANYLTNEPLMLIAGLDPASQEVEHIYASCFPISRRFIERPCQTEPDEIARTREPAESLL